MTVPDPLHEKFVRLLEALEPWLDRVVIVGGWAHRLYRMHPLSQQLDFTSLTTFDTDVALPERLPVPQKDIRQCLKAKGFEEKLLGEHRPPVTHYQLGNDAGQFYAEFLTPLIGGRENRGKSTATVRVAGVTSQRLRYLELALHAPWKITIKPSSYFPVQHPTTVQAPNAASYVAQKLLIQDKREPEDRARDTLYIHDTVQLFGASLGRLREEWIRNVRPLLPERRAKQVINSADLLFANVTDTIRNASIAAESTGRKLAPEELRAGCHAGLKGIFV